MSKFIPVQNVCGDEKGNACKGPEITFSREKKFLTLRIPFEVSEEEKKFNAQIFLKKGLKLTTLRERLIYFLSHYPHWEFEDILVSES